MSRHRHGATAVLPQTGRLHACATAHDREAGQAAGAVLEPLLLRGVSRPRQRGLRRASPAEWFRQLPTAEGAPGGWSRWAVQPTPDPHTLEEDRTSGCEATARRLTVLRL